VRSASDDAPRLARMAKWGDPIARAYAGLLHFALEPSTPVVVSFPMAGGEVSYAALSRADREAEVAVQQSDDPARLLLGYLEWARRGFHFFATRRVLWCTGKASRPPAEFVSERLESLPYRLTDAKGQGRFDCPHLAADEPRPLLEVTWRGAEKTFRVCRRCAKDDRHLLSSLSDGAAVPDPEDEFSVDASLNVRCLGGPECVHAELAPPPRSLLKRYVVGRLSDGQLLDAYLGELRPRIERTGRPTLVAGGVCYGGDLSAFLDALHPTPVERKALEKVLGRMSGYFELDEPAASRALERLWADNAEEIVGTIVADPEEARRWVEEARASPGRVSEIIKRAHRASSDRELLETLPRYSRLVREAEWVDRVARQFRTHGEAGAERTIVQSLPRDGKERGIAFGFLLALGRGTSHAWQFSPTEKEFGHALEVRAKAVLDAPAPEYHVALDRLLHDAGVADWGTLERADPAHDG